MREPITGVSVGAFPPGRGAGRMACPLRGEHMGDSHLTRRRVEANGLSFAVVDQGQGQPVLLLHGFPDSADLWRNQVPALVDAGYRVVAPDLRGFGESDRPEEVEAYAIPT